MKMKKIKLGFVSLLSVIIMLGATTTASSQALKSKLQITVIDGLGNLVEGADVKVFANEADYKSTKNVVLVGKTDKKGRVKLKGLAEGKVYFLDVRKGDLMNDGRAVQTSALTKGTNRVNVIIE
jgi:uncharacterized GH25 family protein